MRKEVENLEKTEGEVLKEKLFNKRENIWNSSNEEEYREIYKFADEYMYYLNQGKTEKEIIHFSKEILLKNDFKELSTVETLNPGDRIFWVNRNRNLFAAVIGKESMEKGLNIVAAHSDSPRIDLKQNPLYEEAGFGLLKTHYYGGIKKYQWATVPLSMHGIIVKSNGEKITVSVNELVDKVNEIIVLMQKEMFDRANDLLNKNIRPAHSIDEINEIDKENKGFIKAMWCGDEKCEDKIKNDTNGYCSRCIPFEQQIISDKCVCCGEHADTQDIWAKSY